MSRTVFVAVVLAVSITAAPCVLAAAGEADTADTSAFGRGHRAYMDKRFDDARELFEQAVVDSSRDATTHAWLGLTWFRLGRPERAWREANIALGIDSCDAVARDALFRALNPQFGEWDRSNADSAWACLLAGMQCDSLDGELAEDVWIGALQRGNVRLADRSILNLGRSGLFRSPLLGYARWLLAGLPKHAILLVNGDADCYPVLVVQQAEHFRSDVTLVHLSLLSLPWYRRYARDELGIPMPFAPATLDTIDFRPAGDGAWVPPARVLVQGWMDMLAERSLDRPLVMSVTVEDTEVPEKAELCGAYWRLDPRLAAPRASGKIDTATTRRGLMRLRAAELAGEPVSAACRSPYVRASGHMIEDNVTAAVMSYYLSCRRDGRAREAEALRLWALPFLVDMRASDDKLKSVRELPELWRESSR